MMNDFNNIDRRNFIVRTAQAGVGMVVASAVTSCQQKDLSQLGKGMKMGLVTYQWGKDWDLPTLIANCEKADFLGVELRTQHAHGVEPHLNVQQRIEVKKRFEDSSVTCVGYGSNQQYHDTDKEKLKQNIEGTYEFIKLCHDIGATGVKVKPNSLPSSVPYQQTIEQIADSLNTVGKFAGDYGQKIRVEVHGQLTQQLPVMNAIFDLVEDPNVYICWNCNNIDNLPPGLESNFHLVKDRLGDTVHIRELNFGWYPYQQLINLFVETDYDGWILLEARQTLEDRVMAMKKQLTLFNQMIDIARTQG